MRCAIGAFDGAHRAYSLPADVLRVPRPLDLCAAITICEVFSLWLVSEVLMKLMSIRLLTWGTAVAALLSAILLAGEDAGLPDLTVHPRGGQAVPHH
jgi:hypothetical protein